MRRFLRSAAALAVAVPTVVMFLAACSGSAPSNSQVSRVLTEARGADGLIEVRSVERKDGRLDDAAGRYTCDLEYDLVFLKDSDEIYAELAKPLISAARADEGATDDLAACRDSPSEPVKDPATSPVRSRDSAQARRPSHLPGSMILRQRLRLPSTTADAPGRTRSSTDYPDRLLAGELSRTLGGMAGGLAVGLFAMQYGEFEAGHTVHKEERITLERWESGWKLAK